MVKYITIFFTLVCVGLVEAKVVVWDLGDTLVYVNIWGMVTEIGLVDCGFYHIFYTKKKDQLQNKIFDVLELLSGKQRGPKHEKSYHTAHRPLPQVMCDWLAGKILHPKKLIRELEFKIDALYNQTPEYFKNQLEYRLVKKAIKAMFNPKILVKNTHILKEAIEIVQEIAQKGVHQQTILSNWDGVSYDDFKVSEAGQELSRYFNMDKIIISGSLNLLKPQQNIFDYCLECCGVPAHECVFIDDQKENIDAARRLGFTCIQIKHYDFKQLRKDLQTQGIL